MFAIVTFTLPDLRPDYSHCVALLQSHPCLQRSKLAKHHGYLPELKSLRNELCQSIHVVQILFQPLDVRDSKHLLDW